MHDFAELRTRMVDHQLRTNKVTDYRILDAMAHVPREKFVDPEARAIAYSDTDILLSESAGGRRWLQKPMVLARLVQAADVRPRDFVLVVGCGTGYALAVVARLASAVVGLEEEPDLVKRAGELMTELGVENADVVEGPLVDGCPSQGPFDVILLDGSARVIPQSLLAQLRDGGRLVCVDGPGGGAQAVVVTRSGDRFGRRVVFNASAPELPGFAPEPAFQFD